MKDEITELIQITEEMKKKIYQYHLTTGIQISCLRDEMKDSFKGLKEDLWYQCDHMKFVNALDSKFAVMESKFRNFVYEPNHIKAQEDSIVKQNTEIAVLEKQSIEQEKLDKESEDDSTICGEFAGENSMKEQNDKDLDEYDIFYDIINEFLKEK